MLNCYPICGEKGTKSTMTPDYTLYLVTDSTAPILKGRNLCKIVKDAIDGGQLLDRFATLDIVLKLATRCYYRAIPGQNK